jgi:hypothetical protein
MDTPQPVHLIKGEERGDVTAAADGRPVGPVRNDRSELAQCRHEKIQEHLAGTLQVGDTWQACLGPVACDLLELCQTLKAGIDESLVGQQPAGVLPKSLTSTIEMYLKVARQIERLAQLDHRRTCSHGRQGAEDLPAAVTDARKSEDSSS